MGVLHPLALNNRGQVERIEERCRSSYTCLVCEEVMIARRGEVRAWHFAHKNVTNCVGGEGQLHKIAWRTIALGIKSAIAGDRDYPVTFGCPGGHPTEFSIPNHSTVKTNKQVLPPLRGDVSVLDTDGKLVLAVEIVVTHDLDPKALAIYRRSNTLVLKYAPKWATVGELRNGLRGEVVVDRWRCHECLQKAERERIAVENKAKREVEERETARIESERIADNKRIEDEKLIQGPSWKDVIVAGVVVAAVVGENLLTEKPKPKRKSKPKPKKARKSSVGNKKGYAPRKRS